MLLQRAAAEQLRLENAPPALGTKARNMFVRLASTVSALSLALAGCSSASDPAAGTPGARAGGSPPAADRLGSDATVPAIPEATGRNAGGPSSALDTDSSAPGRSAGAISNGTGTNKDYVGPK